MLRWLLIPATLPVFSQDKQVQKPTCICFQVKHRSLRSREEPIQQNNWIKTTEKDRNTQNWMFKTASMWSNESQTRNRTASNQGVRSPLRTKTETSSWSDGNLEGERSCFLKITKLQENYFSQIFLPFLTVLLKDHREDLWVLLHFVPRYPSPDRKMQRSAQTMLI